MKKPNLCPSDYAPRAAKGDERNGTRTYSRKPSDLTIQRTVFEWMNGAQLLDLELVKIRDNIIEGRKSTF